MNSVALIQVTANEAGKTVSFSPEHLNRMETARQIAWQLTEVIGDDWDSTGEEFCLNLDFKEISWISSAGLNELIGINSQARSQGIRLVLLDVQANVRDVFALTRLERLFEFSSSSIGC